MLKELCIFHSLKGTGIVDNLKKYLLNFKTSPMVLENGLKRHGPF